MRVLGIETSCDESGLAIFDSNQGLLGHVIYSQTDIHAEFGGVVPERASRNHIHHVLPLLEKLLQQTSLNLSDIDGIAYTKGPGLVGALLVGAMIARTLGFALNKPVIGVHHLEAHLLACFLEKETPHYPFLALLISGGHTELIAVNGLGKYKLLGDTLDDAVGEAFDKTARLLGLGYPGGAALAALAEKGKPRFIFPRPMVDRPGLDFSFSGLKTFALRTFEQYGDDAQTKADIAYAFQTAVVETLVIKCKRALQKTAMKQLIIAGGVGANLALRKALRNLCDKLNAKLFFPRAEFCTDNGAMIAYLGSERLLRGEQDDLSVKVHARWSLESLDNNFNNTQSFDKIQNF